MTKRLMKDALMELLARKNLVNISVKEICETADVHRTTFYLHYSDPAELLREIEQDFLDQIPTPPEIMNEQSQKPLLEATTAFFDNIRENKNTVRVLFSESADNAFSTRLVEHLCAGYIPIDGDADEASTLYKQVYIANGTVGMLREWVNTGFPLSSQRIAEMMYFLSRKVLL